MGNIRKYPEFDKPTGENSHQKRVRSLEDLKDARRQYQTVILAGLLHDIGKFLQRGTVTKIDTSGKHPAVSSNFIIHFKDFFSVLDLDIDLLLTLVQRHHEDPRMGEDMICEGAPEKYKGLAYLVSRADNYSSSERGQRATSYQDFRKKPLVSILSRVRLGQDLPKPTIHSIATLKPESAFPQDLNEYESYDLNRHLSAFFNEFTELTRVLSNADFDTIFSHIMTLLLRYAWCIPANTQEELPDVSLFDHLKTTAAIASCLYQYHYPNFSDLEFIKDDKATKFTLLAGDLAGIQNYIFNITHIGVGGIAKRLRSRSFQIAMITEVISHKILHEFALSFSNILMASGGKFYILLPNMDDTKKRLDMLRRKIDLWFYKQFNGEINLNLAYVNISGRDFGGVSEDESGFEVTLHKLNSLLQREKRRPFVSILQDSLGWHSNKMVLDVDFGSEEKLCKACKRFPGRYNQNHETYLCDRCSDDEDIGRLLPTARHINFYKDSSGDFKAPCDYSFDFKQVPSANPYLTISIGIGGYGYPNEDLLSSLFDNTGQSTDRSVSIDVGKYKNPYIFRFVANHIPFFESPKECNRCSKVECENKAYVDKNMPKFFECLAQSGEGSPLLAYLKADADNLGQVFIKGLGNNNTVSRIATLSRMLDLFFNGYIQNIMATQHKDLYTVYSGGDDLLIIGPWNKVIDFAREVNSKFEEFCSGNKNITLSAGIALVKHNYPVYRAVAFADDALEMAKEMGRDRITLFGHTITWKELPSVLESSVKLKQWLADKKLSKGFVHNLLYYAYMYQRYAQERKTEYLRFLPLMTYDIARNLPRKDDRDAIKREIRQWAEELKDLKNPMLHKLDIISKYALTANRGGKDG